LAVEENIGKQEAKSAVAKEKICMAVTRCLAEIGYAETSINRVVSQAGVSKGALQHHFPTKEDLMTATAEQLLHNATFYSHNKARDSKGKRSTALNFLEAWEKVVNTNEFRALLEILIQVRTDKALRERLSPGLQKWHQQSLLRALDVYQAVDGSDKEVEMLITLNSCMMRGLVIQEQYTEDPALILELMKRWISMVSPLLSLREIDRDKKDAN
jgi:AcrR family transcriptional regulator